MVANRAAPAQGVVIVMGLSVPGLSFTRRQFFFENSAFSRNRSPIHPLYFRLGASGPIASGEHLLE